MTKAFWTFILFLLCSFIYSSHANNVLNIYAWSGEIPDTLIRQFEKETNIKVNFSTYENNEILYAKIRAAKSAGYDIIMPSSYYVDRMTRENMLLKLDKTKIPNWHHLDPQFLHPAYDKESNYSVPYLWGVTGIFYNMDYFKGSSIKKWDDLWESRFKNTLLLLDDTREVFSMALLTLGYSANDKNKDHIKAAFEKLKLLMPNVKVFSSDTVVSIIVDEDATLGMVWNGDAYKASHENKNVNFVFPEEGFIIWVDNLAIPTHAPHKDAAYAFINFLLRPEIAKEIALRTNYPITNLSGKKLLPQAIQNNPIIYPPPSVLKHGQFQTDVGDETLALYEKYWEELKMLS